MTIADSSRQFLADIADKNKMLFTMYNLLVMQLVASAIIVGYMFVKVSYVKLNKYFHPPYQQVLRKARLVAGRRRWSAPADRIRDWYLDWKYQQLEGSNASYT